MTRPGGGGKVPATKKKIKKNSRSQNFGSFSAKIWVEENVFQNPFPVI